MNTPNIIMMMMMTTTMKMTTMTIISKFIQIYRNCLGTFPAPRTATAHWLVPNYTAWWQRQTCVHTNEKRPTAISWVVFSEIREQTTAVMGRLVTGQRCQRVLRTVARRGSRWTILLDPSVVRSFVTDVHRTI